VRDLFARGGVRDDDYPAIATAVEHHCITKELDRSHPDWRLTSLLKDADGLDRVRLYDLNPKYLRNAEAKGMTGFARRLFEETDGFVLTGANHFEQLWPAAVSLGRRSATINF
jgi:hypothetical protein